MQVATSNTDISSEMESESVQASLKDSVKRLLLVLEDGDRSRLLLRTIHQLQSLGIAYHFHQEIRGILMSMHQHHGRLGPHHDLDLHSAALLAFLHPQVGDWELPGVSIF
jgi:hypothetical protein